MAASKKKKKSAPKSAPVKKSAAKTRAAKPKPAKKAPGKSAPAKKAPAKKAPAKKVATVKASAKKVVGKIAAAGKAAAKSSGAKKSVAKKSPAKQTKVAAVVAQVTKTVKDTFAKVAQAVTPTDYQSLLKPLDDRILVLAEGPSETTAAGLIIPGSAAERPTRGKVLAVGTGRRNKKGQVRPLEVNVGHRVIFADGAGTKVSLGGTEFLILREEELLGIAE